MNDSSEIASWTEFEKVSRTAEPNNGEFFSVVELTPGYQVMLLDQRSLPMQERYDFLSRPDEVAAAITMMVVRGAPAIGICAAYGMVTAAAAVSDGEGAFCVAMAEADTMLRTSRPTAVNLAWALDRIKAITPHVATLPSAERTERIAEEARAIHKMEVTACRVLSAWGARFLPADATVLTHCNAGALATAGYGTALGILRTAREEGKRPRVLACETRPYLQGARLTAWELQKDSIPVEVITDSMAGYFMRKNAIDCVIVGADRVALNGDVANKIGTYGLACLAATHGIPFYVAAPWSTFDLTRSDGDQIPIEERSSHEVTRWMTQDGTTLHLAPEGVRARHPAFDVTPAGLITALITERGVARPPSIAEVTRLASVDPQATRAAD